MPEFHFERETHTYTLDGVRLPSVSEIIAPCVDFDGIPRAVLAAKIALGQAVHQLTHLYDLGLLDRDEMIWATDYPGYTAAWVAFCDKHQPQWRVIEKPMHSPRGYAGTPDRHGSILLDGARVNATVDIKNVYALQPATGVQLSGYALLLDRPKDRRFAVQLKPDGTFHLKEYDDETAIFLSLLNINHWRRKHGITS